MKNYFKKFSIMFVMALMFIGIGMIENGSAVNAAITADGWQRYDDTDKRLLYTKNIMGSISSVHYNGSTSVIIPGESVKFTFYGTKLRVVCAEWSNKSTKNVIKIDDNISDTFSSYHSNSGSVSQIVTYEKENLPKAFHKVTITVPNDEVNKNLELDAIDIDNTGYLIGNNESITLDKSTMNLNVGDSQQLTATTTPAGAQVTWKSSDPSVATVDSTGKVTGVKEGTCTITATTADGLTATCVVTVTLKGIEPNPNPTPDPTDTDKIVNIAHAKGTNTNNPGGEVTIIFHGSADTILSVVKTADVKEVWIGDNFTYTLVITNTGTKTAKAVVVSDPAPNHIDFNVSGVTTTQGTVDSSSTSKNIIVNVGDILPGGTVTIKIPSTVIA
ncbi:Ig-like domain-containing protein [Clostridium sp. YIM B02555]|uniref:Ig-like domain-containing protein n=1 Tax=Clostridium sp. YIM B02555 TaxID=2911968 RepID=UPI001EEDDD74|nr:Ig-like domain-containing protein [Clostridium sp. YIM B02555]